MHLQPAWIETDWFREWLRLARRDYQGKLYQNCQHRDDLNWLLEEYERNTEPRELFGGTTPSNPS